MCASSAARYTANGTTSPNALSISGSRSHNRIRCTSQAAASPITTPPTPASANIPIPLTTENPLPAAANTATRNRVKAVASLTRLSPARIVITRRGSPSRRPTAIEATASGGATTAPSTSAAAHPSPGSSHQVTTPTTAVVNTTSPTASRLIGRRLARKPR